MGEATFAPNDLLVSDVPVITRNVTIVSGRTSSAVLSSATSPHRTNTPCPLRPLLTARRRPPWCWRPIAMHPPATSLPRLTRAAPSIRRNSFWAPDTRPLLSRPLSARQALPSTCAS
ncbi:hypothetical protein SM11_chr1459 [Sinorhizobium meliloti SM11]|uniref:Uncharacterized protein n=1 Tax=Sinorhizobium meliloti (strain SM11) TaxID=707241 RepID=F7X6P3_SINMM|nr:hypothetical protein SM11_chr1459 [Sinorhizobium meliloti SM11]